MTFPTNQAACCLALLAALAACVPTRDMPVLTCKADSECPATGNYVCNLKLGRCERCDGCNTTPEADVVSDVSVSVPDTSSAKDLISATDVAVAADVPAATDLGAAQDLIAATDIAATDSGADVASTDIVTITPPDGMVFIAGGTFWMGCNLAKDATCSSNFDENPQHEVTLTAYFIDQTETTVEQYKACVAAGGCSSPAKVQPSQYATFPGLSSNPVNFVSWAQARQYCKWRGAAFDLPTEAQWEMAARGSCEKNGTVATSLDCKAAMRTYPWGEALADCMTAIQDLGGYGCGSGGTWPVGSKPGGDSPYGLHDMAGNVWEWTRDWYAAYPGTAELDPVGPGAGTDRVGRGGSFIYDAASMRSGIRGHDFPTDAAADLGLRCVRTYP